MATDAELYAQAYGDNATSGEFDLGGLLGNIFSSEGINTAIQGLSSLYALEEQQAQARQLGPTVAGQAQQLAQQAGQMAAFEPYTLTSTPGLGGVSLTPQGAQLTTGEAQQALTQQALAGAQTALQGLLAPRSQREAEILAAIEAAREPQRERERLAEEQRLLSQGRIGTQSMMYGGMTPEEFQRRSLIEEQRGRDIIAAMTQAGTEQQQAQQLVSGLLGTAYTPQAQLINLLQAGVDPAKLAQSGRLSASEALQAAISPIAQATTEGEKIAMGYTTPLVQAYTGLLSPAVQTAGTALGASDLASQVGTAIQSGVTGLYEQIFG